MFKKYLASIFVLSLFSSPVFADDKASEIYEAKMNSKFVGQPYEFLTKKLGKPDSIFKNSNGITVFEYNRNRQVSLGGDSYGFYSTIPASDNNPSGNMYSREAVISRNELVSWGVTCTLRFGLDEKNKVTVFAWSGNSCFGPNGH